MSRPPGSSSLLRNKRLQPATVCLAALAILLFALAPTGASASAARRTVGSSAVRYVAPLGLDTANDCTQPLAPCQTLAHALGAAQAGDEIRVAAGTYTSTMTDGAVDSGVTGVAIIAADIAALRGGYSPDFSSRNTQTFLTTL